MKEEYYLRWRKVFFWFFLLLFLIVTPVIVFYSLGYKFNRPSGKFVRTGAVAIETTPKEATVSLDGARISPTTPCTLREMLPKGYVLTLEKEGFHPYQVSFDVRPSRITKLEIVLVPKSGPAEMAAFDFNIYRFFLTQQLFGEKIVVVTDRGFFSLDKDLKGARPICGGDLGQRVALALEGMKEYRSHLVFWDRRTIWVVKIPEPQDAILLEPAVAYRSSGEIRNVFLGLKERYLVIHDGERVIAADLLNPLAAFPIVSDLKNRRAESYYDSRTDILYLRDKVPGQQRDSLFKIELIPLLKEKGHIKETDK